ncbi:glycosyltransferase family 9 protein [Synechococcus sp. CS-1328]|uniref:glycosyltransferase family 9 protein n=1 Tax=Synechococcus sp. CS-1328 TaxID=2847976 RepID=UPI00223BCA77|nr:glycosyltransferase family 9 protein [Synechococcus sp. CS-1328]MCT0225742.1 glycosyltransferase family 9 protein [Synechococcus sp. CS-1328]
MQRFCDQPLGDTPTIVVLGAAKLGNYVVLQPLLRGLREKYRGADLTYVGSRRTSELEIGNPWINRSLPLAEQAEDATAQLRSLRGADLVINADGHSPHTLSWVSALAPRYVVGAAPIPAGDHPLQQLALDPHWARADLVERYSGWIHSNSIRELHCRVAWVNTEFERVELPQAAPPAGLPPVLIAVNGERPAKLWPLQHWLTLLEHLQTDWGLAPQAIGLIGGPPPATAERAGDQLELQLLTHLPLRDLRGQLTLPELVGALQHSQLCLAVDSGPLHLAAAAGCPTLAIFGTDHGGVGASPRDLWAPRSRNVWVSQSTASCSLCLEQQYAPASCELPEHSCMNQVTPESLRSALQNHLGERSMAA